MIHALLYGFCLHGIKCLLGRWWCPDLGKMDLCPGSLFHSLSHRHTKPGDGQGHTSDQGWTLLIGAASRGRSLAALTATSNSQLYWLERYCHFFPPWEFKTNLNTACSNEEQIGHLFKSTLRAREETCVSIFPFATNVSRARYHGSESSHPDTRQDGVPLGMLSLLAHGLCSASFSFPRLFTLHLSRENFFDFT